MSDTTTLDNTIQTEFPLFIPGRGLNKDNFVFYLKDLLIEFKKLNPDLFKQKRNLVGRHKKYKLDELLGLTCLCYFFNQHSCREMAKFAKDNGESIRYLLGDKRPEKTRIWQFLKEHKNLVEEFFTFTVLKGTEEGLIDPSLLTVDGTIVKPYANKFRTLSIKQITYLHNFITVYSKDTSKNSTWNKIKKHYLERKTDESIGVILDEINEKLNRHGKYLLKRCFKGKQEIEKILEQLEFMATNFDGKHTISITDPETRWGMDKSKVFGIYYNLQSIVAPKTGFLVDFYLSQRIHDARELPTITNRIRQLFPDEENITLLADNGYINTEGIQYAHKNNLTTIIPDYPESLSGKPKSQRKPYNLGNFHYNPYKDVIICPSGNEMTYDKDVKIRYELKRRYTTHKCYTCTSNRECANGKQKKVYIHADPDRFQSKKDFNSEMGQELYPLRQAYSEGYFATLKEARQFQHLKRIGLENARTDLLLHAILHNLKKLYENHLNHKTRHRTIDNTKQETLI